MLVKKKGLDKEGNPKYRCCVDFRELNLLCPQDCYGLPLIKDCLTRLSRRAKYWTVADCKSGFMQIELEPHSRAKSTFCTQRGTYEFTQTPFGLKNAPATYQRLMNTILQDLLWSDVIAYVDDLICYGETEEELYHRMGLVFSRLLAANLTLSAKKTMVMQTSCKFLGWIVTEGGIKPNPDKVSAILEMQQPRTLTDVRSFLGMWLVLRYREAVPGFAEIAEPLTQLTKKSTDFEREWNSEACRKAVALLKEKLTSAPLLASPTPSCRICCTQMLRLSLTRGLGGILAQEQEGKEVVIAYWARCLTKAERNYTISEIELAAVLGALKKFRSYLWGSPSITVVSDHAALVWLFKLKDVEGGPVGRLARWSLQLMQFNINVWYKTSKTHCNADGLSRLVAEPAGVDSESVPAVIAMEAWWETMHLFARACIKSLHRRLISPHESCYEKRSRRTARAVR